MASDPAAVGDPYTNEEIAEMSAGLPHLLRHREMKAVLPEIRKKYPDPIHDQRDTVRTILEKARETGELR